MQLQISLAMGTVDTRIHVLLKNITEVSND